MNDERPKWLRGTLAVLIGWWSFVVCLIMLLAVTISLVDLFLPGDGLPILPGSLLAVLSLILSVIATIRLVRKQDRFMNRFSRRANYIVLVVLLVATFLFVPAPFIYTVF